MVHAQNARVVTADARRILELTFDPPSSTQLNTDTATTGDIVSIVFRDDGADGLHLIAADRQRGKVLFYTDAAGTGAIILNRMIPTNPLRPDALSLDALDNLYGTSSQVNSQGRSSADLWVLRHDPDCTVGCLPGGYDPTVGKLDSEMELTVSIGGIPTLLTVVMLEETRLVPFAAGVLGAGDLLVLSSDPPALLRYPRAAVGAFLDAMSQGAVPAELQPEILVYPPPADVDPARRFPAGSVPSGMEITPQGNLLVPSGDGTILIYRPDGTRLSDGGGFVDFASGFGPGELELAVGPQDGAFRAFVSDSETGEVLRYLVEPDGTGTLEGAVDAPVAPKGITTTTANVVQTPAGPDVSVQLTNLMQSRIENVEAGGTTSASVIMFEDPRELEVSIPPDLPLHRSLFLSEIRADLPPDAEIPAYVRAFRRGDPVVGPPTFLLVVVDTNIQTTGVIDHVVDEALILGYEPDCEAVKGSDQQRLFWLPSPSEPPVFESPKFIDISTDCGTSRGRMRTFSLFLASARDTRDTFDIALAKLAALRAVLEQAQCVEATVAAELRQDLDRALIMFLRRRFSAAITKLAEFNARIQSSPGAFSGCVINVAGELRARADSTVFIVEKLPEGGRPMGLPVMR